MHKYDHVHKESIAFVYTYRVMPILQENEAKKSIHNVLIETAVVHEKFDKA